MRPDNVVDIANLSFLYGTFADDNNCGLGLGEIAETTRWNYTKGRLLYQTKQREVFQNDLGMVSMWLLLFLIFSRMAIEIGSCISYNTRIIVRRNQDHCLPWLPFIRKNHSTQTESQGVVEIWKKRMHWYFWDPKATDCSIVVEAYATYHASPPDPVVTLLT